MKKTTIAWIIGLILVIGVSGYLFAKSKTKKSTTTVTSTTYPVVVQDQGTTRENISYATPTPTPAPTATPTPTITPTPSPKPTAISRVAGTHTMPDQITYTDNGLSVRITIPASWKITEQDTDANNVFFSDLSGAQVGLMKVLGFSNETLDQIRSHLNVDPNIYNISSTTVDGIQALQYNNHSNNGTYIILVYKGNTYTFSGQAAEAPFISLLKFL